ncbi:hypothetical protein M0802_007655 [Mischocyttarus mexicanus]|nr:hypothetical protein M0802_007655 [Mischocyttarus mexicanus]
MLPLLIEDSQSDSLFASKLHNLAAEWTRGSVKHRKDFSTVDGGGGLGKQQRSFVERNVFIGIPMEEEKEEEEEEEEKEDWSYRLPIRSRIDAHIILLLSLYSKWKRDIASHKESIV